MTERERLAMEPVLSSGRLTTTEGGQAYRTYTYYATVIPRIDGDPPQIVGVHHELKTAEEYCQGRGFVTSFIRVVRIQIPWTEPAARAPETTKRPAKPRVVRRGKKRKK